MPDNKDRNVDEVSKNNSSMSAAVDVCLGVMLSAAAIVFLSGVIAMIAGLVVWLLWADPSAGLTYKGGSSFDSMPIQVGSMVATIAGAVLIFGIIKFGMFLEFWIMANVNKRYRFNMVREAIFVALGAFIGLAIFISIWM